MAVGRSRGKGKANGMLARRRAALERAASRMAGQRRAAEEAEAERRRREAAFDELVADFELAVEEEAAVVAEVEEEVRRVRERGRVRIDAARVAAARVVWAMGEAGETVAGCGLRLGVGVERVKELRRLVREELAGGGAQRAAKEAEAPEAAETVQKAALGPGGERQRAGVRAPGPVSPGAVSPGAGAGAVPGAAPPAAPAAPAASPPVVSPVGPSGAPGAVGGARPGASR